MDTVEQVRERLLCRFPGALVTVVLNPGPAAQHSLLVGAANAVEVATFLRDAPGLRLDFCSNVTGIDWLEREVTEPAAGAPEPKVKRVIAGYLEVVYHLYSVELRQVSLPSLTPLWRSCEFQEREVFDLFGVVFSGHPDLRRLLMWDEFKDHPMRKDYVEPDDFEWEPTPHGEVLERAKLHYPPKEATP
jgi:NADH-quinone oxidoreductase subunit C